MTDDPDWRLHGAEAVEVISDKKVQICAAGKSTLVVVDLVPLIDGRTLALPIPNATAMLLHASQRAYADSQRLLGERLQQFYSCETVHVTDSSDAVDVAEHLCISVFSAYTALECFANEWVPPWITYRKKDRNGGEKILNKEEIERQLSLKIKLDAVLPSAFRVASPKGSAAWQSFVKLENARNRIVHMKQADRESDESEADTVWKMLFKLPPPHLTAKSMVDWYMVGAPHVPGLAYDNLLPVKPRWFVKFPSEVVQN